MISKVRLTIIVSIVFFSLASIPLVIQGFESNKVTRQALFSANGQRFQELALSTINEIDQMLYVRRQDTERLAKTILKYEGESVDGRAQLTKALQKWKEKYGIYSLVMFVGEDGKIVAASSPSVMGNSVANELWFKKTSHSSVYTQALASGGGLVSSANIGPLEYDSLSGGYGVNITIPIHSELNNKRIGLLVCRINWSEIAQIVNRVNVTKEGQNEKSYALLINDKGIIIAGIGSLLSTKQSEDEVIFSRNLIEENWESAKQEKAGFLLEKNAVGSNLVGYARSKGFLDFTGLGWAVLVVENSDVAFAPVSQIAEFSYKVLALALAFALSAAIIFRKLIRQQIALLGTTLLSLGKGHFEERTVLSNSTELGSLGAILNSSADSIEAMMRQKINKIEAAEKANRAKGEFLAEIGNELRSPLTSNIETSEMLLETTLSEEQRMLALSIRKSSCQLLSLASDIREISRIEMGNGDLEGKPFDLRNLIEEVAELLETTSQHLGIDVVVYYNSEAPHLLIGDPVRIHQVFTNLMTFALRSTQNKQILVSVHSKERTKDLASINIVVEDSGLGLDSDRLSYLFDTTENGNVETVIDTDAGTGELATSKRLIELMGGRLNNVVTEQGIFFSLKLLLEKDTSIEEDLEVNLSSQTVIVSTGRQIIDSVISKYLSERGATCIATTAANLEQTLSKANQGVVKLVTTNSMLCDKSFLDVAISCESKLQIPIVSLSTFNERLSDSKKSSIPGLMEITKPVRKSELLRTLNKN